MENVEKVLAIELLAAVQGYSLPSLHPYMCMQCTPPPSLHPCMRTQCIRTHIVGVGNLLDACVCGCPTSCLHCTGFVVWRACYSSKLMLFLWGGDKLNCFELVDDYIPYFCSAVFGLWRLISLCDIHTPPLTHVYFCASHVCVSPAHAVCCMCVGRALTLRLCG